MSTKPERKGLAAALFGSTRLAVLALLYGRPEEEFYIRSIVRSAHSGHGAVQRELKKLGEAGIIRRTVRGRQVYFQANVDSPIYPELRSLMAKTAGIGDVLREALGPLASLIKIAFLYGSLARGEEKQRSDIDLLIVGEVSFSDVVVRLQAAQNTVGREVNPTVYSSVEFRTRLREKHQFLTSVINEPKIFLIGDKNELGRLAPKRLACPTQNQPSGDIKSPAHRRKGFAGLPS